jgi:hypothetical protein
MALRVGAGWNHLNGIRTGNSSPDQKLVLDSKQDSYDNGIFRERSRTVTTKKKTGKTEVLPGEG